MLRLSADLTEWLSIKFATTGTAAWLPGTMINRTIFLKTKKALFKLEHALRAIMAGIYRVINFSSKMTM